MVELCARIGVVACRQAGRQGRARRAHAPVRGLRGLLGEEVEEGPERVGERLGVGLRRLVAQEDACCVVIV